MDLITRAAGEHSYGYTTLSDMHGVHAEMLMDFGVLRLIVNRPEEAKRVLTDSGVTVRITDMVATVMADRPGGAAEVVSLLSDADIAIEYMYACTGRVGGKALVVMRVDDIEKAEAILSAGGFAAENPEDVYRI